MLLFKNWIMRDDRLNLYAVVIYAALVLSLIFNLLQALNADKLMESIEKLEYTQSLLEAEIANLEAADSIKALQ